MPIPIDIPKVELVALLESYDQYIQEANEKQKYDIGWLPVCLNEFYDNEWLEFYRDDWLNRLSTQERQIMQYILCDGAICPVCMSALISELEYDPEERKVGVVCNKCGNLWNDILERVDVEIKGIVDSINGVEQE